MDSTENKNKGVELSLEIDWLNVLALLWKKAWLILLLASVFATTAYAYTKLFVAPKYSSSIMLYVNNRSANGENITASELSVAQSLVNTYMTILCTQTTMNELSVHFKGTEMEDITPAQLKGMVSASGITDTEVFRVTVTTDNPEKAQKIAEGIAKVLPGRIESIVEGTSMRVVDEASYSPAPVSPNANRNAMLGAAAGFALAVALIFVMAMLDDVIHSEDYVVQTYNMPVLAKIPDLVFDEPQGSYRRYSKRYYRYYAKYGNYKSEK